MNFLLFTTDVLCYCFRKVCPLCKRTVLPSSDDSDVSESEDAPLLENEAGQNREGLSKCNSSYNNFNIR